MLPRIQYASLTYLILSRYKCSVWSHYNCSKAQEKYRYSAIQERVLIRNCPVACHACGDITDEACAFPFKYKGQTHETCVLKDGYRKCKTRGGHWKACTPKGTPCVFPFKYGSVQYTGCSVASIGESHRHAWCATKVDDDGKAVAGHWTTCPNCNVSDLLNTATCGYGSETQEDTDMGDGHNDNGNENDMGEGNNDQNNNDMGNNDGGNDMGDEQGNDMGDDQGNDMGDDNDMGRRARFVLMPPAREVRRRKLTVFLGAEDVVAISLEGLNLEGMLTVMVQHSS